MKEAVIVSAARTAIGKYGKAFNGIKATELGAAAIRAALERSDLSAEQIEDCIMGNVLSAGLGQNPA
ncbi:MAG TPA: acetyl-CoA C-acyltransferase, partial [Candidatus Methanomethylophilaceae archaeon]|nr:acetyl-CoA C-acyltransferase [Candidatus Methanomethylophilaceae archaeon]